MFLGGGWEAEGGKPERCTRDGSGVGWLSCGVGGRERETGLFTLLWSTEHSHGRRSDAEEWWVFGKRWRETRLSSHREWRPEQGGGRKCQRRSGRWSSAQHCAVGKEGRWK